MSRLLALTVLIAYSAHAQSGLIIVGKVNYNGADRNLIYDDALNLTWFDYTRYETLTNHLSWASNLEISFQGRTFSNWRLPQNLPVNGLAYNYSSNDDGSADEGYNISAPSSAFPGITASEMAHLYYTSLGNLASRDANGNPNLNFGLDNTGPFDDLYSYVYWSGSNYSDSLDGNWVFDFQVGNQRSGGLGLGSALAVHSGNLAAIPEPSILTLMVIGLTALRFRRS